MLAPRLWSRLLPGAISRLWTAEPRRAMTDILHGC
jgi:hypothetical protein